MPVVQMGKPGSASAGLPILELWDIAANGSFRPGAAYSPDSGAGRKHFTNGSNGHSDNGSVERTFYWISPSDQWDRGYPIADQMAGASKTITKLRTYAWCPVYGWSAGFTPELDDPELVGSTPNWTRITYEATLKKLGTGALDQTCFGWQGRGNSGPWNTNGGFRCAPMVTLYSPENQGDWTEVICRLNLGFGNPPFTTFPLAVPVDATVFHRLKTVVTLGPVFSVEFYIDGVLVISLGSGDLPWADLELGNIDINALYPTLNPSQDGGFFGSGDGMEGPYMSHLLVEVV